LYRQKSGFFLTPLFTAAIVLCFLPKSLLSNEYLQTNLVSDIPGMATTTDPNLKNPWGVSFAASSPFWVSDNVTSVSSLYGGNGSTIVPLVVGVKGFPTGQIQNSTTGFVETDGKPAAFIFDTLGGQIYAWNPGNGVPPQSPILAELAATSTGSVFTGLTLANNQLYAADFRSGGGIKVFDSSFAPVTPSGSFTDANVPSGWAPYNIQMLNGKLYVEYAQVSSTGFPSIGGGLGYVGVFDLNGNFLSHDPGNISKGALNVPWGITFAPPGFGDLGGDLLVGNFGNGWINAFDPTTGAFIAALKKVDGTPFAESGLWTLTTRAAGSGFDANAVYFTAGINGQADGLFGRLDAVPEPVSVGLATLGCVAVGLLSLRKRFRAK
jgi:uncharacterized protein (TIGR03118 family)